MIADNAVSTAPVNYITSLYVEKIKGSAFRKFKTMEFNKIDSINYVKGKYYYEYIDSSVNKLRLFFDFDKVKSLAEYNNLITILDNYAEKLHAHYAISGYTTDYTTSVEANLTYYPKVDKDISLHVVFYDICLDRKTYKQLMTENTNDKLFGNELDDMELDDIPHIDCTVYKFKDNSEQLFRMPFSDKESRKVKIGYEIKHSNVTNNMQEDLPYSLCIMQCSGNEKQITLKELEEVGLYKPATSKLLESTINRPTSNSLAINNTADENFEPFFDDAELSFVKEILRYSYINNGSDTGDKTHEFVFKAIGIICSATSDSFAIEDLINLFNWWANIDKNGKEWKFNDQHFVESRIKEVYNKKDPRYEDYTEESYLHGMINELVPDKKIQKNLKSYVNKVAASNFKIKSNDDYHQALTVVPVLPSDIRNCRTRSEKLNLIAKSVRYSHGIFLHMIDRENSPGLVVEDRFRKEYVEVYFNHKDATTVVNQLKINCSCDGKEYKNGFQYKHLDKGNPLENIKDEHPETKEDHVNYFKYYVSEVLEWMCHTEDFRFTLNAWRLRNPGTPCGIIEYIHGHQGTGKTFYGNFICKLFDDCPTVNFWDPKELVPNSEFVSNAASIRDFTHNFNDQTDYHKYDLINETTNAESQTEGRVAWNELKRLNDPMKRSEGKGKQARFIQNTTNITITTNYLYSIVPDYDDRRLYAVTCNPKHNKNDVEFWKKTLDKFSEPFFVKHIYDYLTKEVDISNFNPRSVPETSVNIQIKEKALSVIQEFYCIYYNRCRKGFTYQEFEEYCRSHSVSVGLYKSYMKMWDAYVETFTDKIPVAVIVGSERQYKFFPDEELYESYRPFIESKQNKLHSRIEEITEEELKQEEESIDAYIESIKHEESNRQSHYYYVLLSEVQNIKLTTVKARLLELGYAYDKHLTDPKTTKRSCRGWKLIL